ncbi:MAG: hypothetical protein MHM6MM_000549 [Cercozoa sp. M6MM]
MSYVVLFVCNRIKMAKQTNTRVAKSGIASGANKGHIVTPKQPREQQSRNKGRLSQRNKIVRQVIRQTCGFAPYEKRVMEILKSDVVGCEKKATKLAKKRLGTLKRAQRKVSELQAILQKGGY